MPPKHNLSIDKIKEEVNTTIKNYSLQLEEYLNVRVEEKIAESLFKMSAMIFNDARIKKEEFLKNLTNKT